MTDFLLGVIAVSVFVMAAIQVALIVGVIVAARRGGEMVKRLEADVRPIVANLQAMSNDAARATSLAAGQVERADQLITTLSKRVEETVMSFHATVLQPARDALSLLGALRTAMNAFRAAGSRAGGDAGREAGKSDTGSGRSSREEPRAAGDDDDNLFVG